jgi:hypothetical protein
MWIMVAGTCRCGEADAARMAEDPRALNAADLAVRRLGHVPVVDVDLALPASWRHEATPRPAKRS